MVLFERARIGACATPCRNRIHSTKPINNSSATIATAKTVDDSKACHSYVSNNKGDVSG